MTIRELQRETEVLEIDDLPERLRACTPAQVRAGWAPLLIDTIGPRLRPGETASLARALLLIKDALTPGSAPGSDPGSTPDPGTPPRPLRTPGGVRRGPSGPRRTRTPPPAWLPRPPKGRQGKTIPGVNDATGLVAHMERCADAAPPGAWIPLRLALGGTPRVNRALPALEADPRWEVRRGVPGVPTVARRLTPGTPPPEHTQL